MANVGEVEILTHNGRPVAQGGKRLGYRLLRRDGTVWEYWTHPGLAAQANRQAQKQAKKREEEERPKALFDWYDLPVADYANGWCRLHGRYSQEERIATRQGTKTAYRCPSCGTLKRPR